MSNNGRILSIITNAVINNKNELWKTVRLLSKFSKTQCNLFQSSSCLSTVSICATFCIFEYLVCFSYHLLMLWAVFVCFTQFGGRLSQCQNFDKFRNTAPLFKLNLGNKKTLMQQFVSSNLSLSIDSLVLLVISPETRVMSLEIFSQDSYWKSKSSELLQLVLSHYRLKNEIYYIVTLY